MRCLIWSNSVIDPDASLQLVEAQFSTASHANLNQEK